MANIRTDNASSEIDVIAMSTEQPAYVDWSAVLAGTAIASAMSLLLYGFGSSIGLYVAQPWSNSGPSTTTISMAVILFAALAFIYSLGLGSYFAGRMRPRYSLDLNEAQFRDGASGLIVWAVSLLIGALLTSNLIVGTADRVADAGYKAVAGVSSSVSSMADAAVDNLLRPAIKTERTTTQPAANAATTTPESSESAQTPAAEATPANADTPPSPATPAQPASAAQTDANATQTTTVDVEFSINPEQREQIARIVARSLSNAEMSERDKQYLANVLEENFGYTPEEALAAVNENIDEAITKAKAYAQEAKANAALAGFWTAVVLLLSAVASWWAATLGGSHRDESTVVIAR